MLLKNEEETGVLLDFFLILQRNEKLANFLTDGKRPEFCHRILLAINGNEEITEPPRGLKSSWKGYITKSIDYKKKLRERGVCGKIRYISEIQAKEAAKVLPFKVKSRAYFCEECKAYHLTTQPFKN